jgi:hypothetical protein
MCGCAGMPLVSHSLAKFAFFCSGWWNSTCLLLTTRRPRHMPASNGRSPYAVSAASARACTCATDNGDALAFRPGRAQASHRAGFQGGPARRRRTPTAYKASTAILNSSRLSLRHPRSRFSAVFASWTQLTRAVRRATPGGSQRGWCRATRSCRTLRAWLGSVPYEDVRPCRRPFATGRVAMIAVVERPARRERGRVASPAPPSWWPTSRWRRWEPP